MLYPDGLGVGPQPGEDAKVLDARNTGRARVDDVAGGSQILVPVSRGGNSALPVADAGIRVVVDEPGPRLGRRASPGALLAVLGLALLAGSLVVVDRLGRSFVQPIRQLAEHTQSLGRPGAVDARCRRSTGRPRCRSSPAPSTASSAGSSCSWRASASPSPTCPTGSARPSRRCGCGSRPSPTPTCATGSAPTSTPSRRRSTRSSARPGAPSARASTRAPTRSRCSPTAYATGRRSPRTRAAPTTLDLATTGPLLRASRADLEALVDVLLDNVFSHTADADAVRITLTATDDRVDLVVEDAGPGLPAGLDATGRGASGAGSTGLGLSIAARTAEDSGGEVTTGPSDMGGARVAVTLRTA